MRVVIADDSALLREGLSRLLVESGIEVCATVPDAAGLADAVTAHRPDVAIVDIRMPPTFTHEGAIAAVALRSTYPDLGILLLSQAIETHFAAQLLERHAAHFGYLLKDRVVDVSVLTQALETIATWENACGKLPSCRRARGSYCSASRPRSLRQVSRCSNNSTASSR